MKGGTILDKKYAIMLVGLPGTGKTTISNRISSMLSFFCCSTDTVHSKLFDDAVIKEDRDYSTFELNVIYNTIMYIAEIQAKNNMNILVDGVFRSKQMRFRMSEKLIGLGYLLFKYYIVCDEQIVIKRLQDRKSKGTSSPAGIDGYWIIKNKFEIPTKDENFSIINNSGKVEDIMKLIYNEIQN